MTAESCPVCRSGRAAPGLPEARDYVTGETFAVYRCADCGLGFTTPRPADMGPYYPARYRRYTPLALRVLRALYNWRTRAWVRPFPKPGVALEVGCGDGYMLDALRRRGWEVVGTERTEDAANYARTQLGLNVVVGGPEAVPGGAVFDLVVLFQVLEHMSDPLGTLRECARLLKPGGALVVGVPNWASWQARRSGRHWLHLDVPRHLNHFSPDSLGRAAKLAGLEVASVGYVSVEHDPFGWVQSWLNRMGFRQNWLTRRLMGLDPRTAGSVAMTGVAAALAAPAAALAALSWVARSGALMEARLTKPA